MIKSKKNQSINLVSETVDTNACEKYKELDEDVYLNTCTRCF